MKELHLPPKYHGYKGGYDNVNYCTECGTKGLYEDMHEVDPCPYCGGEVQARHLIGRWIKPKYRVSYILGIIPYSRTLIKEGYWELKEKKVKQAYRI